MSRKLNKAALASAVGKITKLRIEDVGGRKERPAETVQSCLNRGYPGLGSPEGIEYIVRFAIRYYLAASPPEQELTAKVAAAEEAENEAKDCFWAIYPEYLQLGGKPVSTEAARTALAAKVERLTEALKAMTGVFDTPIARRRIDTDHANAVRELARAALGETP